METQKIMDRVNIKLMNVYANVIFGCMLAHVFLAFIQLLLIPLIVTPLNGTEYRNDAVRLEVWLFWAHFSLSCSKSMLNYLIKSMTIQKSN